MSGRVRVTTSNVVGIRLRAKAVPIVCIWVTLALGLSGCSHAPKTSSYQVMKVLQESYTTAARVKARSGSWPSRVQELAPLAEYSNGPRNVVRIGGAHFHVEYVPKVSHEPPWNLVALTRSNASGALPILTREVYVIRTDGMLMVQRRYNTLWLAEAVAVLGLAAMVALPIVVWRAKVSSRRRA